MKTFQRVPPQSTRVQRTVCIWCRLRRGTNRGKQVRASGLLPRQSLLPKTLHLSGDTHCSHPTRCPHAPSQEPQAWGTPSTLQLEAEPQSCGTSSPAPAHKQLYSQKHYYMINTPVFPSDNIHNSSAPGIHFSRYQVLLHTCCQDPWDQQHQRIHLVTQNKQIIAGLFQVSFGSVFKQHDFSSPGFRKGVWLWA